jgi:glycosyltransferase involved in cell wall biosynthesis
MREAIRSPGGLLALRSLVRALRDGARAEAAEAAQPPVLHAHWWIPAGLAAPREFPCVLTLHGTDVALLRQRAVARWIGGATIRRARIVTTVSPELARIVAETIGRHDVLDRVQPMPVDSADRPWSRGGGGAVVVARLTAQKRVSLAIRAVAELDIPLTIIGDGPDRKDLEQLASRLNLRGGIRFTGTLRATEVARILGSSDVMLFPAIGEGLGLAAVEALMAGVPVVACGDGGGVVSAVRAHGGGMVADPTPGAIATAVRAVRNETFRSAARKAGEIWRAELAPDRVAERFEGWYQGALDG